MITAGIIVAASGLAMWVAAVIIHAVNIVRIGSSLDFNPSLWIMAPFALGALGSVALLIGTILLVVAAVLHFL